MIKVTETFFSILRKSLIFASLISGVYFIVKSLASPSVTGAFLGSKTTDFSIVLGVALLLLSLALAHRHDNKR